MNALVHLSNSRVRNRNESEETKNHTYSRRIRCIILKEAFFLSFFSLRIAEKKCGGIN